MEIFTFNKLSSGMCKTYAHFCERIILIWLRLAFTKLMLATRDHFSLEMLINHAATKTVTLSYVLASLSTPMMP